MGFGLEDGSECKSTNYKPDDMSYIPQNTHKNQIQGLIMPLIPSFSRQRKADLCSRTSWSM